MRILLENVKKRTVLTSTQVRALGTTDRFVLRDPGDGKAWLVKQVLFKSNAGTAATGGNIRIRYNTTSTDLITVVSAANLMPTAGRVTFVQALTAIATASQSVEVDASAAVASATSTLEIIVIADLIAL